MKTHSSLVKALAVAYESARKERAELQMLTPRYVVLSRRGAPTFTVLDLGSIQVHHVVVATVYAGDPDA